MGRITVELMSRYYPPVFGITYQLEYLYLYRVFLKEDILVDFIGTSRKILMNSLAQIDNDNRCKILMTMYRPVCYQCYLIIKIIYNALALKS